jgi:hypothetical protein
LAAAGLTWLWFRLTCLHAFLKVREPSPPRQ